MLKALAGSGETRHDGADGDAGDMGDLLIGEFFELTQDDHFAEFGRQGFEAALEGAESGFGEEDGFGVGGLGGIAVQLFIELQRGLVSIAFSAR